MNILVGVSRRHVHLNRYTCKKLFGTTKMPVRNPLNQPGQYASTLTVDLKWNDKIIEHVRICGPIRKYNQVEISTDEANIFNIDPPARQSGDLEGSLPITLIGPKGEITLKKGLIRADKHIHMSKKEAKKNKLKNKELVIIKKGNKELFKATMKIEKESFTELHIDTFEEKLYDLHQGEEVELIKCGK